MRSDETATMLVTYSFCNTSDTCLENKWNYIDRPCKNSSWSLGKNIDFDTCNSSATTCHSFVSSDSQVGIYTNYTENLALSEYCLITIDTTNYEARVIFDDAINLGVIIPDNSGYQIGDVYTLP
jgi:hypothetical protein